MPVFGANVGKAAHIAGATVRIAADITHLFSDQLLLNNMERFSQEDRTLHEPLLDTESSIQSSAILSERPSKVDSEAPTLEFRSWRSWAELQKQCWLAFPMVYVNLIQYSIQIISLMFVGHLGELSLSSAAIATSFAGVTGNSLLLGMGSALETLCGQAYGARQYHLLWLFLLRAEVVLNATSVPIAILWWNMGKVLLFFRQDTEISLKGGDYARCLIPALFAYASLQPLVKYLQTQSIIVPMAILSSCTWLFHIPLCYLLVFKSGLGNRGAALATGISNWLNVILIFLYVRLSRKCAKSRTSISWEELQDLTGFLKLAIPSALMICMEYWAFEALIILSGLLPNPQLETSNLSICLSTTSLIYMIPLGLSAAVSTRVSNELGAGCAQAARAAVYVSLGLAALETVAVCLSLFLSGDLLGRAYSSDQDVIQYVSSMMPLIAGTTVLDGVQGVLSGIARGCGWQRAGAFVNLGAYYIVGLPIAILLGFPLHLHGKGLWMGIFCGVSAQTVLLLILTVRTDWEKQAKDAAIRVSSSTTENLTLEH